MHLGFGFAIPANIMWQAVAWQRLAVPLRLQNAQTATFPQGHEWAVSLNERRSWLRAAEWVLMKHVAGNDCWSAPFSSASLCSSLTFSCCCLMWVFNSSHLSAFHFLFVYTASPPSLCFVCKCFSFSCLHAKNMLCYLGWYSSRTTW